MNKPIKKAPSLYCTESRDAWVLIISTKPRDVSQAIAGFVAMLNHLSKSRLCMFEINFEPWRLTLDMGNARAHRLRLTIALFPHVLDNEQNNIKKSQLDPQRRKLSILFYFFSKPRWNEVKFQDQLAFFQRHR